MITMQYFCEMKQMFTGIDQLNNIVMVYCDIFLDKYWDKQGPIFVYTGNEGDILGFWNNCGFVFEAAANFSALVIFPEHVSGSFCSVALYILEL